MSNTIKITIPGEQDLEYYKQIGHIVFKMDQLKDGELITQTLLNHIKKEKVSEDTPNNDTKNKKTTLQQINNRAEI